MNQNDCSFKGTKKLLRSGHRRMNRRMGSWGADRVGGFGSKRQGDCGNVRAFRVCRNSVPRRYDVSYQPFLGLTER